MTQHIPVLASQVIELLSPAPGMTIVDGTVGAGGHAILLAEKVGVDGMVIGIDRDPNAIAITARRISGQSIRLIAGSYCELPAILQSISIDVVDAILLDLGLSSDQLADASRGFSFQSQGELDMRFDASSGEPAWRLLERWSEREIADTIYQFGEERFSRRIARSIVERRRTQSIRTAQDLAALVRSCVPRSRGHAIDPATRTFQAMRIAVNRELEILQRALAVFPNCLRPGGRLAVIAFHSLEDRLVKNAFQQRDVWTKITKKPMRADDAEIAKNPRARSARLRVAEKK